MKRLDSSSFAVFKALDTRDFGLASTPNRLSIGAFSGSQWLKVPLSLKHPSNGHISLYMALTRLWIAFLLMQQVGETLGRAL